MLAEITRWAERSEDVVDRGDEQAAPQCVAALGDPQLRLAALVQPGHQPK
ncbi:MAG: hypothetical protein ACT4OZ_03050 [Gemmatimonadota bacterium]